MIENILTLLIVTILGVVYGHNIYYLRQPDAGKATASLALIFNLFVTIFIGVGVAGSNTLSDGVKLGVIAILVILVIYEGTVIRDKPSSSYTIVSGHAIMFFSALFKLYWIISLHCGYGANFAKSLKFLVPKFELPKAKVEPRVRDEPKPRDEPRARDDVDINKMWNAAINILNENLRNSGKSEEEKQEAINKLRVTFGKEPKEFKERT
jgi:hypothetical protein